jgi:DNA repair exonuclease SbcCD ATPase subunit
LHKEIHLLVINKAPIPLDQAYDYLTSSSKQRKVIITLRESAAGELIKKAQALGHELFAKKGGTTEDALFTFLRQRLAEWDASLSSFAPLARTGKYPGGEQIEACQGLLRRFVEERDSLAFLKRFVENKQELLDLADDFQELDEFYKSQKHSWEGLRSAVEELVQNRLQLEAHADAGPALARMEEILAAERPYGQLPQAAALIDTVRKVNGELVAQSRGPAVAGIQRLIDSIKAELDKVSAEAALRSAATGELTKLLATAAEDTSIAHIAQAAKQAEDAFDRALAAIEKAQSLPTPKPGGKDPEPSAPAVKKRRVVEVRGLCPEGFLETAEDVTAFLGKLEEALRAAVNSGERVQIK